MKRKIQQKTAHIIKKDDSRLRQLLKQLQREREILGIEIDENSFDPDATIADWYRERAQAKTKLSQSRKQVVREFALLITPAPNGGYLAYCPAIYGYYGRGKTPAQARKQLSGNLRNYLFNLAAEGKPLPRSTGRIEKLKIAVPVL